MKIVLASHNRGKIEEINAALSTHFEIKLISQAELGINEISETGMTFVENALIKARHAATMTNLPAMADDSGLIVDVLQGAPGIYSARYAGENATSKENIQKLLIELKDTPSEQRTAYFYCVLVFLSHPNDPAPLICEGRWPGIILSHPQGEHGFGYDPVFFVPSENKTAAELPLSLKNKMSHRGKAMKLLLTQLADKL